jgi:hypothetical protein
MKDDPKLSKAHAIYDNYFTLRKKLLFSESILKRIIVWFLITIWLVIMIYGLLISYPAVIFIGAALISLTLVYYSTKPLLKLLAAVAAFDTILMICSAIVAGTQAPDFNPAALLVALLLAFVGFGFITPLVWNTMEALGRGQLTWNDIEQCKEQMIKLKLYSEQPCTSVEKDEMRNNIETIKDISNINIGNNQMQSAFLAIIFAVITLTAPKDIVGNLAFGIYAAIIYAMIIFVTNMATTNVLIGQTSTVLLYELS